MMQFMLKLKHWNMLCLIILMIKLMWHWIFLNLIRMVIRYHRKMGHFHLIKMLNNWHSVESEIGKIVRISCDDQAFLQYLQSYYINLNQTVVIKKCYQFDHSIDVIVNKKQHHLTSFDCQHIWVVPEKGEIKNMSIKKYVLIAVLVFCLF